MVNASLIFSDIEKSVFYKALENEENDENWQKAERSLESSNVRVGQMTSQHKDILIDYIRQMLSKLKIPADCQLTQYAFEKTFFS